MKQKMTQLYREWCALNDSYVPGIYNQKLLTQIENKQKQMEALCPDKKERQRLTGEIHLEIYPHLKD